mgnify:CR=1 FL=1
MDFSNYINVNPDSDSFQNYPYILLDNNLHTVWVDLDGFDIFYGMRDIETNTMQNIQKINDETCPIFDYGKLFLMTPFNQNLKLFYLNYLPDLALRQVAEKPRCKCLLLAMQELENIRIYHHR